jgi:predicted Zn finger-like uncharacterized protein
MYTQCPECLSVFSLDAPTLAQAHAFVTCGYCGADFDSLATLADELPPEPFNEMTLNAPSLAPPRVETVVYRPQPPPAAVVAAAPEVSAAVAVEDFSQLVFTPRFARTAASKVTHQKHRHLHSTAGHSLGWALACGVLTLLLGAQVAWATRAVLISTPPTGAWLRASCAALHCTLPLVAAPDRLRLLDSNVQTHPSVPHALMISARVRNDAAFAQPYPVLTLTLSNAQGQRLAMRRLRPREYLDDTAGLRRGLAPGSSTVLLLEVADPGDQAVAFEFAFE